jgi:hypothetical protein
MKRLLIFFLALLALTACDTQTDCRPAEARRKAARKISTPYFGRRMAQNG